MHHRYLTLLLLTFCMSLLLAGCDDSASQYVEITDRDKRPAMRLVTLAPALSQMIVDIDQAHLLAGVSRSDDAAPVGLPIVGDIMDIQSEALLAAKPTHVLIMLTKEGVPTRLQDLARRSDFQIVAYPSPTSMAEIGTILLDEAEFVTGLTGIAPPAPPATAPSTTGGSEPTPPAVTEQAKTPSIGTLLNQPLRAQRVKLTMLMRLGKLGQLTAEQKRPRVLLVLGTNPVMVVGPNTVHHQLLTTLNALNAAGDASVGAPTYDRENCLKQRPMSLCCFRPKPLTWGNWMMNRAWLLSVGWTSPPSATSDSCW
ncbi:MAG: hypothetical protein HC898_04855 [Phycisphaerales bacterium]|nr:hypothetical protein [Phycisphaerales bacterium]